VALCTDLDSLLARTLSALVTSMLNSVSLTQQPKYYLTALHNATSVLLSYVLLTIKLGLPTSATVLTMAVLVSARPSVAICSFHEPGQLGSEGGASSPQLQLSGTHCHFTFAPRPSVAVSFEQGSRLIIFRLANFLSENY